MAEPSAIHRLRAHSGAVLVQVAVALLAFTMLSAFVIDYGVQLISRNQMQNAVDAAALGGATALGFDSYADRSATGPATTTALAVAANNLVWKERATAADVTFPVCADTYDAGASGTPHVGGRSVCSAARPTGTDTSANTRGTAQRAIAPHRVAFLLGRVKALRHRVPVSKPCRRRSACRERRSSRARRIARPARCRA